MKALKSTRPVPALSPDDMLRVAGQAAPQQPSAVAARPGDDLPAVLSVRMTEGTLEALARFVIERGTTQRRVIAEALAQYGVQVSSYDLKERPQPRRRGRD